MLWCCWPGLPSGLFGWGPWYGACCAECVLPSLYVVVTPNINQPSTMPLIHSTAHKMWKNFQCQHLLLWTLLIDACYSGPLTPLTLPASARKLFTIALLLQWLLVLKRILLMYVHDSIMVLVSAYHLMSSNVTWRLKSLLKEKIFQSTDRQSICMRNELPAALPGRSWGPIRPSGNHVWLSPTLSCNRGISNR